MTFFNMSSLFNIASVAVLVLLSSGTPKQVEGRLSNTLGQMKDRKLQNGRNNNGRNNNNNNGGGNGGGNNNSNNNGGGNNNNSNNNNNNNNGGGNNNNNNNNNGDDSGKPFCRDIAEATYKGTASSVDVDGSGPFPPTTGDLSIATNIKPVGSFSDLDSVENIKAICTLTNGDLSAPFCKFESTLSVNGRQGKTVSVGTPPALSTLGGTGDFVGAWGEILTGGDIQITPVAGGIELQFTGTVSFCLPASN